MDDAAATTLLLKPEDVPPVREFNAGGRSPFGLRSELQREASERGPGYQFRVEVNQQYRTRWLELLMVHKADHGSLPTDNAKNPPPALGRLSPN